MAHEITTTDTVGIVASKGWHGLGREIPGNWTALEALESLGLDWEVWESTLLTATLPDGSTVSSADAGKATVRSDTREVLGLVGPGYCPIQNRTLAAMADSLGSGDASPRVDSAGSLAGGRKVFISLRGEDTVMGGDECRTYLLLANSHDGSGSLRIHPTSTRVVCANTYAGSERDAHLGFAWRHTAGLLLRQEEIISTVSQWRGRIYTMTRQADALASVNVNHDRIRELFVSVYERQVGYSTPVYPSSPMEIRRKERAVAALSHMSSVFDRERGIGCKPSMWLAANAASNWVQHCSGYQTADERQVSSVIGTKGGQIAQAFGIAASML